MRNRSYLYSAILLLCSGTWCAAFMVYLQDGTSKEVTQIEFRGSKSDLYLDSGMVMTVPTNAIAFGVMGMQRPDPAYGISTDGKTIVKKRAPDENKVTDAGPPQAELKALWDGSSKTAVAQKDTGSIRKNQTVRIVVSGDFSFTVIAQESDGKYRRVVLGNDLFYDNFEFNTPQEKPRPKPVAAPEPAPVAAAPVARREFGNVPAGRTIQVYSLLVPFAMSLGILALGFGVTVATYRLNPPPEKGSRLSKLRK